MNWKLQRNKKGQFTGILVNENGDTKPQPRDKNGKFINPQIDSLDTYQPIDYKFPEVQYFPVFSEINIESPVLPPSISIFEIGDAFAPIYLQYSSEDVRKAFIAGINSGKSYLNMDQRVDIYMSGVESEKKAVAQRKV